MADVTVTLAAPWEGHQIGKKVSVTQVQAKQLRKAGVAEREQRKAPAKKAVPAKKAAAKPKHEPHGGQAADDSAASDSAGS